MTIYAYFFDSVGGDKPYSAADFARAFGVILQTGVLAKESGGTDLGFLLGGAGMTTVYAGKAVIEGHFIESDVGVTLTVPAGSYSGLVVLRLDILDSRTATIEIRTDQTPQQDSAIWELPLWEIVVTNGVIGTYNDVREQGGAVAKLPSNIPTYRYLNNGVYLDLGVYSIALTPELPPKEEKLVWIKIDN
jgi:hypothetical protein